MRIQGLSQPTHETVQSPQLHGDRIVSAGINGDRRHLDNAVGIAGMVEEAPDVAFCPSIDAEQMVVLQSAARTGTDDWGASQRRSETKYPSDEGDVITTR